MSKVIKTLLVIYLACLFQTNVVKYLAVFQVAPDFMIATLVALCAYQEVYGGICSGMLMGMLYDSTLGYVLALNLIAYSLIGYAAPKMRTFMEQKTRLFPGRGMLLLCVICLLLTAAREMLYLGYLFLIGGELGASSLVRFTISCLLTTLWLVPISLFLRVLFHPTSQPRMTPAP